MSTKKQIIESGETLVVDTKNAFVTASDTEEYGSKDRFILTYHKNDGQPAYAGEGFKTIDELIAKMKTLAPLSKWSTARE